MARKPRRDQLPNMVGKVWEENEFRRRLANMIERYDAAWRTKKTKREWDGDWAFLVIHTTEDQARCAGNLLALHLQNEIER